MSTKNGLVLLDRRIVILWSHKNRVLCCLHAAHQGVVGKKARPSFSVPSGLVMFFKMKMILYGVWANYFLISVIKCPHEDIEKKTIKKY